ncbi:MAG: hypothetical protein ABJF89_10505 [Parasphingorhabdus sp.]|uniref:hypothetical protein n=1 Tax=Parasphingorhabdus sp. TaxID=2709688 RepID=UPI003267E7A7
MHDKEKREQIEFFLKYGVMMVGAVWLLWSGTDLIDKRAKILGREAMPIGDTTLVVNRGQASYFKNDKEYCDISGSFSIKNAGALAFKIDEVEFNVYRIQDVEPSKTEKKKLASYSLSKLLVPESLVPGSPDKIRVEEIFSPENILQRSFGFVIPHEKASNGAYYSYVISANAKGGLPEPDRGILGKPLNAVYVFLFGNGLNDFGMNDLRHDSAPRSICVGQPPISSEEMEVDR